MPVPAAPGPLQVAPCFNLRVAPCPTNWSSIYRSAGVLRNRHTLLSMSVAVAAALVENLQG